MSLSLKDFEIMKPLWDPCESLAATIQAVPIIYSV